MLPLCSSNEVSPEAGFFDKITSHFLVTVLLYGTDCIVMRLLQYNLRVWFFRVKVQNSLNSFYEYIS